MIKQSFIDFFAWQIVLIYLLFLYNIYDRVERLERINPSLIKMVTTYFKTNISIRILEVSSTYIKVLKLLKESILREEIFPERLTSTK